MNIVNQNRILYSMAMNPQDIYRAYMERFSYFVTFNQFYNSLMFDLINNSITPEYAGPLTNEELGTFFDQNYFDALNWMSQNTNEITFDNTDPNISLDGNLNCLDPVDDIKYPIFDEQNQTWPTIPDIIHKENFVRRQSKFENCSTLANKQLNIMNAQDAGLNNAYQIYKRSNGIDLAKTRIGVSYIIQTLQASKPVMVGIDYGDISPNPDNTTNHFVVIVGMGTDSQGRKYFQFYDNQTNIPLFGASPENKLYYNSTTGEISGIYPRTNTLYKVSQIRRNVK